VPLKKGSEDYTGEKSKKKLTGESNSF